MHGFLSFYKEIGITSFKAIDNIRHLFNIKKCGHLGTLDPMAEGVLPICLGNATRFANYIDDDNKQYIAQFQLGITTDTLDTTGTTLSTNTNIKPMQDDVQKVVSSLVGERELEVPAFSAKKINGVRAYKLARSGKIDNAGTKTMNIYLIDILSYEYPTGILQIHCYKGTYIRSIIHEMGKILGCGATMSGLVRSSNGIFNIKNSYKIEQLEELKEKGELEKVIMPITSVINWPKAIIKNNYLQDIKHGTSPSREAYRYLPLEERSDNFFIQDEEKNLIAVASHCKDVIIPLKLKMVFIK